MLEVLQEAIEAVCDIPRDRLEPDADLKALGVDSLAVAEIFVEVEIRLGRELPVDLLRHFDQVKTVGDVARELGGVIAGTP
jgi:acyl carrier protein